MEIEPTTSNIEGRTSRIAPIGRRIFKTIQLFIRLYYQKMFSQPGFLGSFSLYNTLGKLVAPATSDEIACIHGVRAVATVALLFAHKFLPVALTPYTNRLRISEVRIALVSLS